MDPNKSVQLDPKLREAYERVMGSSFPSPASNQPKPAPPSSTPNQSPMPSPSVNTPPPQTISSQPVNVNAPKPAINQGIFVSKKPNTPNKLKTVLIVAGGAVFFIAYAIFWMVIFKIPIPFLPI